MNKNIERVVWMYQTNDSQLRKISKNNSQHSHDMLSQSVLTTRAVQMKCCSTVHLFIRLHRMHEMQTIVTDDRGVCQSIMQLNSAFAKSLWPLVHSLNAVVMHEHALAAWILPSLYTCSLCLHNCLTFSAVFLCISLLQSKQLCLATAHANKERGYTIKHVHSSKIDVLHNSTSPDYISRWTDTIYSIMAHPPTFKF